MNKETKKQVKMKELDILSVGNLGVKGFEVRFQKEIEDTLDANGFKDKCWWHVLGHHENICWNLYNIYQEGDILSGVINYYNDIKQRVDKWVKEAL